MPQQIQWYPGHMHKAARAMRARYAEVDVFIELRDARIPYSSENPLLKDIRGDKPCLVVLCKADLADPAVTCAWQAHFARPAEPGVWPLAKNQPQRIRRIPQICRHLCAGKRLDYGLTAMVIGIPNVGKSTLINALAQRRVAHTGDQPAVTRAQQRVQLEHGVTLLDTPGVLWANVANAHSGYRLAACGAIRDTALSHEPVAEYLAAYLLQTYPQLLQARYKLSHTPRDADEFLQYLGEQRGYLLPGGQLDRQRIATTLLTEFRHGQIGRISLETPAMIENGI